MALNPLPSPLPEGRGDKNSPPPSGGGRRKAAGGGVGGVTRGAGDKIKRNAKVLRKNMTDAEKKLWYHLRAKRFENYKFRRQHPIGNYIADFICLKSKMIIELDGGQHNDLASYDSIRTTFFESQGFMVLRFWNHEMLHQEADVLTQIFNILSLRSV